jgi:hypothetical protein
MKTKNGSEVKICMTSEVIILNKIDDILDFMSNFPAELKTDVLRIFDGHKSSELDLAVFLRSNDLKHKSSYYFVVAKIVTMDEEDNGLVLMYSEDLTLLALYMETATNVTYEEAVEAFNEKDGKSYKG